MTWLLKNFSFDVCLDFQVCLGVLFMCQGIGLQIHGPGVIVEVDESKFAKCEYGCGHSVKAGWVLGGTRERK